MTEPRLDGEERLETPERVDLAIDLAGVGSRGLACFVDTLILTAFIVVLVLFVALAVRALGVWALVAGILGAFVVQWLYFAVNEAMRDGQTPGKRLLGIRVQRIGGYPIGWSEALIRNFLRIIDGLLGYSVGIAVMLLTPRSQRLGDLAAGTVVVRERALGAVGLATIGYTEGAARSAGAAGGPELTGAEFEMLHDFLARRDEFAPASRTRIARMMSEAFRTNLADRGGVPATWEHLGPEPFLVALDAAFSGENTDR